MQAAFFAGNRTLRVGGCVALEPAAEQVQIRVAYCGICGTDLHLFHGAMAHRLTLPHVMGHEMSATIAAVGSGVAGWRAGDRVTVRPLDPCGHCPACVAGHSHICHNLKFIGIDTPGALQGMWTVPAHTLHRLPEGLALREGAMVEPVAVACHDVRLSELKEGEFAAVIGGGPIGILVALVAQARGARGYAADDDPPATGARSGDRGGESALDRSARAGQRTDRGRGRGRGVRSFGIAGGRGHDDEIAADARTHRGGGDLWRSAQGGSVPLLLARTEANRCARV
jgi:threonine dehydrogenase-like Zn-dependent dehydrogenase